MGSNKETDWPKPSLEDAIRAGMAIAHHYSTPFSKIKVEEPIKYQHLTDREAERRLLDLADHIMDGTVTSHVEIARVVRSLSPLMGPLGSASTEIDLAAFKVHVAIIQKQQAFQ